mmetsp:Transcript_21472/g.31930  ORF Transcript_21472/g.31930 Transcript_21472/m.31930 type:complete len:421 (-) Transcript_21472:137-1399(-)
MKHFLTKPNLQHKNKEMREESNAKLHLNYYLRSGWPSVESVEDILRDDPTKATLKDGAGLTPLHLSTKMDVCPEITRLLLDVAPGALYIKDNSGETALSRLCEWWTAAVPSKWQNRQVKADCGWNSDAEQTLKLHPLESQWEKIILMLRVASRNPEKTLKEGMESCISSAKFLPLHTAAYMGCPPTVLRHLHLLNKGQIKETDEITGRIPLSIAAASCFVHGNRGLDILQELLRLESSSASLPDQENRYPLHLAIESGKTWDTGIESIVLAAPSVLRIKDNKTGLFPFMASAQKHCINDAYMLLTNCPEVIAHACTGPQSTKIMHALTNEEKTTQEKFQSFEELVPMLSNEDSEGEYDVDEINKISCRKETFIANDEQSGGNSIEEESRGIKRQVGSFGMHSCDSKKVLRFSGKRPKIKI